MKLRVLGRYEIKLLLGAGGAGRVYAAEDLELNRMVAIRALPVELADDHACMELFRTEAETVARLNHPNIAVLHELAREGPNWFMVMELVAGQTLDAVLGVVPRLGLSATRAIVAQATAGLDYAHRMGVVHGAIKPSNFLLTESGLLKILDFGLIRVRGSNALARLGVNRGVAPEQIRGGEGDQRADVFGLASVAYQMLAGAPAFQDASNHELVPAQREAPSSLLERLASLDASLGQALERGLAKNPEARFQSVHEFGQAFGADLVQADAPEIVRDGVLRLFARGQAATRTETREVSRGLLRRRSSAPSAVPGPPAKSVTRHRGKMLVLLGAVAACVLGLGVVAHDFFRFAPASQEPLIVPQPNSLGPEAGAPSGGADNSVNETPNSVNETPPPRTEQQRPANSPAQTAGGMVKGVIGTYTEDGWPVLEGKTVRLVGIQPVAPERMQKFLAWVTAPSGFLECEPIGDGFRCLTNSNEDVAQSLLLNGQARSAPDANEIYLAAEREAQQAHKGIWK